MGPRNSTRLVDAARAGDFDTVLALLQAGHDVDERDEFGGTALMYAVAARDEKTVRQLIQHGADVTITDDQGRTAASYAALFSCPDSIVKLLGSDGRRSGSLSDAIEVRGVTPQDVVEYARRRNPDLAVLASLFRSLDEFQQGTLILNAHAADVRLFERALREH